MGVAARSRLWRRAKEKEALTWPSAIQMLAVGHYGMLDVCFYFT